MLGERDYRVLWIGLLISDIGTWMQIAGLGIYAAETTGKASWVGLITTVTYLATGLLAPFGGTLSDRHDRRLLIGGSCVIQAAISTLLVLALHTEHDSPLTLWALAGLQGVLLAVAIPAINSMVPDIVKRERVSGAMSLLQVTWNGGRSLGPVVAVIVIARGSYDWVFALNGLSFVVLALLMLLLPNQLRHHSEGGTIERLLEGISELRATPASRRPLAIAVAEMSLIAPFIGLIPAMAQVTLHGKAVDTGHLFAAQGIGSMLGVLVIASLVPRFGQERTLSFVIVAACVLAIAYALSPTVLIAVLLVLPLSGFHTSSFAGACALVANNAHPRLRGRMLGIFSSATNLCYALSSVALAFIADLVGLRAVLVASAVAMLTGFVIGRRKATRSRARVAVGSVESIR